MLKKHLTFIAYVAISLLFLNTGLSAASYNISSKGADGSERILVCTSKGYQWISLADLQNPDIDSTSKPIVSPSHCPFCTTGFDALDGVIDNPSLSINLNSHHTLLHRADLIGFKLTNNYLLSDISSRAPPL